MERLKRKKEVAPRSCLNCCIDISHRDYRAKYCSKECGNKFQYKTKKKDHGKA